MRAKSKARDPAPAPGGFFRGHQVARVLAVAVPLVMFMVWWGVWGRPGDPVSTREVSAVVVSVDGKTCLVRVESGQEVRILKPRNVIAGMRLRMHQREYANGELRFDLIGRAARADGSEAAP